MKDKKYDGERAYPVRMCVVCRERRLKPDFIRVVRIDGKFSIDLTQKSPGRGAYICKSPDCAKKAEKQRKFNRAFRGPVPDEIYEEIQKICSNEQ